MQFISKRTLKFCVLVTFSIFWKSACATILRNFNEAREWSFLRSSITVFPPQSIFQNCRGWKISSRCNHIFNVLDFFHCLELGIVGNTDIQSYNCRKLRSSSFSRNFEHFRIISISEMFWDAGGKNYFSCLFFQCFLHECEIRIFFFLYDVNFIWKWQQNYIFLDRFKRIT